MKKVITPGGLNCANRSVDWRRRWHYPIRSFTRLRALSNNLGLPSRDECGASLCEARKKVIDVELFYGMCVSEIYRFDVLFVGRSYTQPVSRSVR